MPNSRHKAAIDSFLLAARTTNRIRCSLTSVLDHDIVPVLPGTKLYSPWCNGCLDITCNGCHETIQLKLRPTKIFELSRRLLTKGGADFAGQNASRPCYPFAAEISNQTCRTG